MTSVEFQPTEEQQCVIFHPGSAFVDACPGAGKTMVLQERARTLFSRNSPGRGVAFLSFTVIAVSELETRLRQEGILPAPVFPNFIGTFDSFLWNFFIAPFGIEGSVECPRLIADIEELEVAPYNGAHALALSCFNPETGVIDDFAANRRGFDVSKKSAHQLMAYATAAKSLKDKLHEKGRLGFNEARAESLLRLRNPDFSPRLAAALSGRFREIIVDEAQDCNPQDLEIISWFRDSGLPVKVVCDPNQSIFEFRGGVTHHLLSFASEFDETDRLRLSGNFRSTPNICKSISQLRPLNGRTAPDTPRGKYKQDETPVYILSYPGSSVPASIGQQFKEILEDAGIDTLLCPIVAATRASAATAAGQPRPTRRNDRSVRLAEAVTSFHFAAGFHDTKSAIDFVHELLLDLEGKLEGTSYRRYLVDNDIGPLSWRPMVLHILRELRFSSDRFESGKKWHAQAKSVLENAVTIKDGQTISQKLKWNNAIETALAPAPESTVLPRTIHSVKGAQFPAVCVVTTSAKLKGILDFLQTGEPGENAEEARKLYVAASRAERILVIAAPSSQAERFAGHLRDQGAEVSVFPTGRVRQK